MFIPFVETMSHGRFLLHIFIITIIILLFPHRQSKQRRRFWERERGQKKPTKANSVLSLLLSFSGTDFFFFHSLTHFVFSLSLPPTLPFPLAGCRVSLSSCHTGPPTLTHGGREGERNSTPTCCRRSSMMSEVCFSSQSNKWAERTFYTEYCCLMDQNSV